MPIEPAHEKVSLAIIEAIEPFSETVKESRRIRLRIHRSRSFQSWFFGVTVKKYSAQRHGVRRAFVQIIILHANFSATSAPPRCNLRVVLHVELAFRSGVIFETRVS